ncbi:hypothetical protein [Chondrinema litorale]|uniref:hypothetical protein n=1 Tax=Chondrinema litorale TaxID=2994555 RepID=UPI002542D98A|nr:hypothetical protein [Chondrinema litorale]UZR96312.1 hypothetical protein OQ292_21885 [Chondrinema litorale]
MEKDGRNSRKRIRSWYKACSRKKFWYSTSAEIIREYPLSGVGRVCNILGKQRQAYYKAENRTEKSEFKGELVLEEIEKIRQLQPRIGCVKLHHQLQDFLQSHKIKLGEKKLRGLLKKHGLLKPHRRKIAKTTYSGHGFRIYKNLVKDVKVTESEQVWVSDITASRRPM